METLKNIEKTLRMPIEQFIKPEIVEAVRFELHSLKASFILTDNEEGANHIAVKECIFEIQNNYISVLRLLQNADYYAAWRLLERVEIDIKFLLRHYEPTTDEYKILFIKKYVSQLQQLFPYKLFASSEYVKKDVRCNICGAKITLRNRCSHKKGELYMGKMCGYEVHEAEFLAIALVSDPFNRYAVAGVTCKEDDPYKYSRD